MLMFLVTLGMIIAMVLRYTLNRQHVTWLDAWGLILGNSRTFRFNFLGTKFLVISPVLGCMVIAGAYQGQLYGSFHRKPSNEPISVSRLIAENYTFLIKKFVTDDLIEALQIPSHQLEHLNYSNDDETYEKMLHAERPLAMFTNYWQFKDFVRKRQMYEQYDIVPEVVIINQICAYMRHQSYLMEPFNRILNALNSAGLIEKWMHDVDGVFGTSNKVAILPNDIRNPEPVPLSLRKIVLVFMGLVVLYVVSFVVFLVEIIADKIIHKFM